MQRALVKCRSNLLTILGHLKFRGYLVSRENLGVEKQLIQRPVAIQSAGTSPVRDTSRLAVRGTEWKN